MDEYNIKFNRILNIEEAKFQYGVMDVLDMGLVDIKNHEFGIVDKMAGNAAYRYVEKVINLALEKKIDATVTNALNKEAINLAGFNYAGHTEIYAKLTNTEKYTMMLAFENLRVAHVSTHVSLRDACNLVKKDRVLDVIKIADEACKKLGIANPKVGVAGLNPHSSENGMFGWEEKEEIGRAHV